MKNRFYFGSLLFCFSIGLTTASHAQQEFTLTTSPTNITSAQAVINLPQLNGNPHAIILAIPQGNTKALNQNPVGVWYYSGKWYVFNSNFAPMLIGLTYKIQYYLNEGPTEFLHLVTQANLIAGESYIDHPALNDKPAVQFSIMQNHSPDIRGGSWRNPHEAKAVYNITTGRWYLKNINTQPLQKGCAYNIVMAGASTTPTSPTPVNPANPANPTPTGTCNCPASLPPNGQATGDLTGMYPNPMVAKILNRPLSNTPPATGQVLKWNGTEWSPSQDLTGGNITNGNVNLVSYTTAPQVGQVLKWNGSAWYPADDNTQSTTTAGAGWQAFFKSYPPGGSVSVELNDVYKLHALADMKHTIVLTKKSRLIISADLTVIGPSCVYGCPDGIGDFFMHIDNNLNHPTYIFDFHIQNQSRDRYSMSNYMIDLDPGTHFIEFFVRHKTGSSPFLAASGYSSIIVTPL